MITIAAEQISAAILDLFDLRRPTMPRAFNVLEGVTKGQILVDDLPHPSWAVVREASYGTLYIGGEMDAARLESVVQYFGFEGEVGMGCWLDDPLNEMIPSNPDYDGRTLYFTERAALRPKPPPLPAGYRLAVRDQDLFSKSFDYKATLDSFGTAAAVLQHSKGIMILQGDTLVCEASTGAPTHGRIEVGVETAKAWHGQGFATLACTCLIEICEMQGYLTWWDCAKQNIASTKLARRLGYQNEREYRYVWWAKR